jgi:GT2 family glycosyltransferase
MMPVAIAGMHRAGTSMVAHALKLASVYFGEDADLYGPTVDDNPDGYWEHLRFIELNDEILNRLGGGWERPPEIPRRFRDDERLEGLEARAKALVREFAGREPWALKDPRTSLTIGLWSEVARDPKVVVCLRSPLEVTLSLRRRAMFSYGIALELWETYYRRLLEATEKKPRIVTAYETYFDRPRPELRRLFEFCDVEPSRAALDKACDAVNPDLRHSTFTVQDLLEAEIAPEIVELYIDLRREAGLRDPAARRPRTAQPTARTGPVVDVRAMDVTTLRQRVKQLESIVAVRELELGYVKDGRESEKRAAATEERRLSDLLEAKEQELARGHALLQAHERVLAELAERTRLDERLVPSVEALQGSVYDLQAEAERGDPEYRRLVRRVREAVRENVPFESTVLVASKGDDDLLSLYGRKAWHFPRAESGVYAGFYPQSELSAIAHVEALRARGADHIVFPATALWWFDSYPGLARHLENRYRRVALAEDDEGAACAIFELRASPKASDWKGEIRKLLDEYRLTFGRDPSVLDWHTGLELASEFPDHVVFSPPERNGLPYLDGTVDIVAVLRSRTKGAALYEADRVASAAMLELSGGRANGYRVDTRWKVEPAELPSVSIVIPCFDGIEHTRACLSTLRETLPAGFRGEIIVVDDASTDGTADLIEELAAEDELLRIVRNPRNRGFLDSANRGAEEAGGDVLVFLNNDTILLPGWLEPLLRVFAEHDDAGAVGGRLLYPDGRLQEAGGIMFADGSAWKYGYGDTDPSAAVYEHFRAVDYCSGCLLATPRALFTELGAFDTLYRPGFFEDTDYCFAVRDRGLRVYYEPQSTIVHVEGATAGTDLDRGPKRHQTSNKRKFVRKWRDALSGQPERPDWSEVLDGWALAPLASAERR